MKTDPQYRLRRTLRDRVLKVLRGKVKSAPTLELLGCSIEEAKRYIEAKFQPGMSWSNHGMYGWHIDHIKPCVMFDLTDPAQQRKCFHYTNLQPLWAFDNLSKHDLLTYLKKRDTSL